MAKKVKSKRKKNHPDRYRHVVLRLWGKNLDPDKITKALDIAPTSSWKRGNIIGKSGKKYWNPYGQWNLEPRTRGNARFETQIKDVLDQIKPKKKVLRRVLKYAKADLKIGVQPHENLAVWGYGFAAGLLNEFTSLGIDICFSVWLIDI